MINVQDLVKAHVYQDEEAVIQDALRHLLRARPEARLQLALYRYQHEQISIAKAASLAGVSWAQMKDILLERGIIPRLGVESVAEAQRDIEALHNELEAEQ